MDLSTWVMESQGPSGYDRDGVVIVRDPSDVVIGADVIRPCLITDPRFAEGDDFDGEIGELGAKIDGVDVGYGSLCHGSWLVSGGTEKEKKTMGPTPRE